MTTADSDAESTARFDDESDVPAGETVVEVSDVVHSYGDLDVLTGVTFSIERGSVTCLVGPNGSGKTTLMRAVAGLLDHTGGTIEVTASSSGGRDVGYLAQQPAFRPQFTVRETLDFYQSLVGKEVDVTGAIDRVGLTAVSDRRVSALSGGMLRLLGLAQATIGDPPLLVLDEPSSGLDPTMTRHITGVVSDIAASGTAVLLATHDLLSVERIADEVLILGDGELAASGSPDQLLSETDTDRLADALASLTRPDEGIGVSAGQVEER